MENNGYYKSPSISKEHIVFISDDDIWRMPRTGGEAIRLTTSRGRILSVSLSPDGKKIAYAATDSGNWDIYVMSINGGIPQRITHKELASICRWSGNNKLIYSTTEDSFKWRESYLYEINIETLQETKINVGPADYHEKNSIHKATVLGRNLGDPARWKRYRGGTAGTLWIDEQGKGDFRQILKNLKSNLANPCWVGERLYFISDHEGIGNIYSCTKQGRGLKRHTDQDEYYVRNFSVYEDTVVYQCGADIYTFHLNDDKHSEKVDVQFHSFCLQAQERFESPSQNLQDYAICPQAQEIAFAVRGKLFTIPAWGGAAIQLGDERARYKKPTWCKTKNGKRLVAIALDQDVEEHLVYFDEKTHEEYHLFEDHEWGMIREMAISPNGEQLGIITNRCELKLVDFKKNSVDLIESAEKNFSGLNWSSDGRYLAYQADLNQQQSGVKIYETEKKKSRLLFNPVNMDGSPVFSQCGKYLFFTGVREYHPAYAETHYEITFPFATKAYAVLLQKNGVSPLEQFLNFETEATEEPKKKKGKDKDSEDKVSIDFEGIESRIVPLPFGIGGIGQLISTKEGLLYLKSEVKGVDPNGSGWGDAGSVDIHSYSFKDGKSDIFQRGVSSFTLSVSSQHILLDSYGELRLLATDSAPSDGAEFSKKDGWIDISRLQVRHHPRDEWYQMYKEAWVLQREHFWTEDMSKVDWEDVYVRYLPLLDKVNTRSEFSDLIWEMQGELGTSHCYEVGGDYHRRPPYNSVGRLGGKFSYLEEHRAFRVDDIYKGDSWIRGGHSPLQSHRVCLENGDLIYSIDGQSLDSPLSMGRHLEGKAGKKVNLIVKRKKSKEKESICVDTVSTNSDLIYRQWVEKNKNYVHEKSGGKLGYVHIPDMGAQGFAEFYRYYLAERLKDGLIVDVRYNGGGSVSQHILKILAQKTLGYDESRYFGSFAFPDLAVKGPLVGLTNEMAGSDGDIFSHCFKLMKLGKLVGKRTWGGVIGMWPRNNLNDGAWTSQPEFSFWFKDVGFAVENYGTDPDIEVEITPKDWQQGKDPQLDKAIQVGLQELEKNPVLRPPSAKERPNLRAPVLPKRK